MPRSTLVVGSQVELLNVTRELLELDGRMVRIASNGAEAISLMKEQAATTVLIDDDLMDFSGVDLAHHLKAIADTCSPPRPCMFIALRGDMYLGDEARLPGFDYVLYKPLAFGRIVEVLTLSDVYIMRSQ